MLRIFLLALLFAGVARGSDEPLSRSLVARWLSPRLRQAEDRQHALQAELDRLPVLPVSQQSERIGWHSTFALNASATKWLQVDLGRIQSFDSVTLVPVDVAYGTHPGPGFGFPVRFRVEVSDAAAFSEPRLLAAYDNEDFPNPGAAPVFLATPGATGRYVRMTATRLWPRDDRALFALGEMIVLRGSLNLAALARVTCSDAYNNPPAWQPANATDGQTVLGAPVEVMTTPGNGWHATRTEKTADTEKWVGVDLGQELAIDEVRLFPARPKDFPARRGFGFPVRFRVEASADEAFGNPIMLLDCTHEDFENPAENPVVIPAHGARARYVRVTATRLWARTNDYVFALGELEVWSGGTNVALSAKVIAPESTEAASWKSRFLIDGFNSQGRIVPLPEWLRGLSRRRDVEWELAGNAREQEAITASLGKSAIRWGTVCAAFIVVAVGLWLQGRARARRREVEQLRQRIASDLHDEIGSNLGSIALLSQMALRQPGESQGDLAEINRVARETADSMRDLVWFIKPSSLGTTDFVTKLRETAGTMLAGLEWSLEGTTSTDQRSIEVKRQIFLIFKETLHNVRKHASASRVEIRLREEGGLFEMSIADDGRGFAANGQSSGHGLISMSQRAEALGGTLVVDSAEGSGTRIVLRVKVPSQWKASAS